MYFLGRYFKVFYDLLARKLGYGSDRLRLKATSSYLCPPEEASRPAGQRELWIFLGNDIVYHHNLARPAEDRHIGVNGRKP